MRVTTAIEVQWHGEDHTDQVTQPQQSIIIGTGTAIPEHVVTNEAMTQIMDTTDEWIRTRSGVVERRFVDPGITTSDLATQAVAQAAADAEVLLEDVDVIVSATMTPDLVAPGISGLLQHKLGIGSRPMYDIRHQCSGFLFGLDLADALIRSGKAGTVAVVGAEVHSGYLPWSEPTWSFLRGETAIPPSPTDIARATRYRDWSVLFGDGAGAAILKATAEPDSGFKGFSLHTDGSQFDLIMVPGVGFKHRPYVDEAQLEAELHMPTMRGRELFRKAVRDMPRAIREVAEITGTDLDDIDIVLAHQANARIVDGVAKDLGADRNRVPVNIDKYGNTTAATLPILLDDMRKDGRVKPDTLVCFTAFGAGAHWGAGLYRHR